MNDTPPQARVPNPRALAARVLNRVISDRAFAASVLDTELARHPQLDVRDRALLTELVYGVLRTRGALSARLRALAPRGVQDSKTELHLWVAAYQLLLLDRVPSFAAVNAAVDLIRAERGPRVAGFANAVLRRLAQQPNRPSLEQAIRESAPAWLLQRLTEVVGEAEALGVLGAGGGEPSVGVRLIGGRPVPDWLVEQPSGVLPRSRRLQRKGDPRSKPGYSEGAFVVQEEGAQLVAALLGARAGERVLDACAGRGQKSSLLAELVGPSGAVVATDVFPQKLEALEREFSRLGLPPPETRAVDWTVGTADLPADFDRVLVDAPCTGTGTLRHRPEILDRLGPDDPARLATLSSAILRSAASRAKPGGSVIFAVCSLLKEECEGVVDSVADLLDPAPFDSPELSSWVPPGQTSLRLLPLQHGTDGYFVASLRRKG